MNTFLAIIRRDLTLSLRQGGGLAPALGFMLAVIILVPVSIGPDLQTLQRLAPGMMWLTLFLAILLTADRIYTQDLEDGSLELFTMAATPLEMVALAKSLAHWLGTSLPLAIITPFLALMLNMDTAILPLLWAAMIPGSLALSMLAGIGGAVAAGLKRGGLLIALLVLPLNIPVMVFGISATSSAMSPAGAAPAILILLALTLLASVISPWASAAALRTYLR